MNNKAKKPVTRIKVTVIESGTKEIVVVCPNCGSPSYELVEATLISDEIKCWNCKAQLKWEEICQ